MDGRLYFALGDLVSNVLAGVITALVCAWVVVPGWSMLPAMLLAMALGMALSLLVWVPLGICFGAMEVMLPVMLSGMVAGMAGGMVEAMMSPPGSVVMLIGAFCGLLCVNVVWILNNHLRGSIRYD